MVSTETILVITAKKQGDWVDEPLEDPSKYMGVTENSERLTIESGVGGFDPATQEVWLLLLHSFAICCSTEATTLLTISATRIITV